jgi:uncharacterized protein YcfL
MNKFLLILTLIFLTSCSSKGLIETNQKKIYLSNTKVLYDVEKKSFKLNFSINNYTKETMSNFVYQIIFKDDKGVAITTVEEFYRGAIESKKAKRASVLIDDFTRKNYKSFEIEIKK